MSDQTKRLTHLPRPVPALTHGTTVTGSEVINCRITVSGDPDPAVRLSDDGYWEAAVPEVPVALSDFTDLAEDQRLGDDGWRNAGIRLIDRMTALVGAHPVKAKRHLVQIGVPASTTRRNLRNLAQGLIGAGRPLVITRQDAAPVVRDIRVDLTGVSRSVVGAAGRELRLGGVLGAATALARDLDSLPDGTTTIDWWRQEAKSLTGGLPGTRVKVRGVNWLERKSFGGLLAVSRDPAATAGLVELIWDPAAADGEITDDNPDAVIVGGASVPAVIRALAELRAPEKVVGIVPVTGTLRLPSPPLPGRSAEVLEHCGGLTTSLDITGDEAERVQLSWRLAVADSLAYGAHRYRPARIIDVGPATTAARVALGTQTGALFTGDRARARRLVLRGAKVGERWWPMPVPAFLDDAVNSRNADLTAGPEGPGAVTAALYLRRFTGDVPFIHLDTAGPARADAPGNGSSWGATGFAAATLVEWLRK